MVSREILEALITKQIVEPKRKHSKCYTGTDGYKYRCILVELTRDKAIFTEECIDSEASEPVEKQIIARLIDGFHVSGFSYVVHSFEECEDLAKTLQRNGRCAYLAILNIIRNGYDLYENGYDPDYCAWLCTILIFSSMSSLGEN